jgi:hypothetical protein
MHIGEMTEVKEVVVDEPRFRIVIKSVPADVEILCPQTAWQTGNQVEIRLRPITHPDPNPAIPDCDGIALDLGIGWDHSLSRNLDDFAIGIVGEAVIHASQRVAFALPKRKGGRAMHATILHGNDAIIRPP